MDSDQVDVSVRDGVAVLRGEVDDWREVLAAAENAIEGGALRVRSELEVRTGPTIEVHADGPAGQ